MIRKEHLDDVVNKLVKFLEDTLRHKGLSSFVFCVSGGVDTALVAALCARSEFPSFPIEIVGYREGIFNSTKVSSLCHALGLTEHIKVDIDYAFRNVAKEVRSGDKIINDGLASCLKMVVLDRKAKVENGVVVGGLNRDEDMILRPYHKRGQGSADIFPIADLHKSEIRQLAEHLGVPHNLVKAESTLDTSGDFTRPYPGLDDIWLTSDKLEWARTEMENWATHEHGTDFNEVISEGRKFFSDSHNKNLMFPEHWTKDEKELMEHIVNIENSTRHKHNPNIPVCRISDKYREKNDGDCST